MQLIQLVQSQERYHAHDPAVHGSVSLSLISIELVSRLSRLRPATPEPAAQMQSFLLLPTAPLPRAHALHQRFQGALLCVALARSRSRLLWDASLCVLCVQRDVLRLR